MMKKPRGNTMEGIIRGELGIIVLMLKGDSLENKFIQKLIPSVKNPMKIDYLLSVFNLSSGRKMEDPLKRI